MKPKIYTLEPTYKRDSGLWVRDLKPEDIVLPDQEIIFTEISMVKIPGKSFGGNHQHPRVELFMGLSEKLELVWQDEFKQARTLIMQTNHSSFMTLYFIPPHLPHAVHNASSTDAYLLEFASEPQRDVLAVKMV